MVELGELENRAVDFAQRNVRLIAVSVDGLEDTARTQSRFLHLIALSDANHQMTDAIHAMHAGVGPGGSDVAAPTTLLMDGSAKIRWVFRPNKIIVRLKPDELLAAVDQHLLAK